MFSLVFQTGQPTAVSMEKAGRELCIDISGRWKTSEKHDLVHFFLHPKNGIGSPKTGFIFIGEAPKNLNVGVVLIVPVYEGKLRMRSSSYVMGKLWNLKPRLWCHLAATFQTVRHSEDRQFGLLPLESIMSGFEIPLFSHTLSSVADAKSTTKDERNKITSSCLL